MQRNNGQLRYLRVFLGLGAAFAGATQNGRSLPTSSPPLLEGSHRVQHCLRYCWGCSPPVSLIAMGEPSMFCGCGVMWLGVYGLSSRLGRGRLACLSCLPFRCGDRGSFNMTPRKVSKTCSTATPKLFSDAASTHDMLVFSCMK